METSDEKCSVCGQTHPWPDGTVPKHPHTPVGGSTGWLGGRDHPRGQRAAQRGAEGLQTTAPRDAWPFDPVLRQALVDKGILTYDDLRAAEAKIRDMSAIFNQGGTPWSQTPGERRDSSTEIGRMSTER